MFGKEFGKGALGVEPGAHRRAALRQRIEFLQRALEARDAGFHLGRIAGKFLAEGERSCVLGMRAADLDDGGEFLGLRVQRRTQVLQRRQQAMGDFLRGGDVHGGREAVVRRLAQVDLIVGMDRRFRTQLGAELFVGAIGDHLVDVHVGLGAGAGLPDDERKLIVEFAVDDLLRGCHDRFGASRVERPELKVGLRRRQLDDGQRRDQRARHVFVADAEIQTRALGLRAPIAIGGNLDRAE